MTYHPPIITERPDEHDAVDRKQYFAHALDGAPESKWQKLEDHLHNVADRAATFAKPFNAYAWGYLAGLWHDVGKYSAAFQKYLKSTSNADPHLADFAVRTDHSTAGAKFSVGKIDIIGHLLAYPISGHHSGLLDGRSDTACLEARLAKRIEPWNDAPPGLLEVESLEIPEYIRDALGRRDSFSISFFVRMLFSCLVDADYLDTELFMDPERSSFRTEWPCDIIQRMGDALDGYIEGLQVRDTPINRERSGIRRACLRAAADTPGLFSLTVPTGGGKTLSSLAFALRHASIHHLRRVIYVVPFTSIIEQNADVFREVMGPLTHELGTDVVIEHHCNLNEEKETLASLLATENWDAPLIVTTSVQFYESLFASRTSRCRKLHNLARSVIILDEVQNLPVDYLSACLRSLRELAGNYGATVVLCTATQPAVQKNEEFLHGLEDVREIIPEPARVYDLFRRVKVVDIGSQEDEAIVERLIEERQVLCIVNTRGHARQIYASMEQIEGRFHLSALMCPAHRSEVLREIKQRVRDGLPCRVISTQLVEAGVDIDFPVVYRSLAGLDSIAQAAGRCNRNGELRDGGLVYVFRSKHLLSERFLAETADTASEVLDIYDDPLSPDAIQQYFRLYYWKKTDRWDSHHIIGEFNLASNIELPFLFNFRKVSERFHLIENKGKPIIIPWREGGARLCEQLRNSRKEPGMALLRRLQRYSVQVPFRVWNENAGRTFELVHDRYPVLTSPEIHYRDDIGLMLENDGEDVFLNV
jgi:CRISPR-associated endonuclease/helicase Cas3